MIETFPEKGASQIRFLRNQYWSAFKHATDKKGNERDDNNVLAQFTDEQNDHALFIGWYDYVLAVGSMPIEAQAHQVWYFAKYPEKLSREVEGDRYTNILPNINAAPRAEQKKRLRKMTADARNDCVIMQDSRTDQRPLILR
jgi:hypothetical protein